MHNSTKIILSLGANIGERESTLKKAVDLLTELAFLNNNEIKVSSFYETEPVGIKEQNNFLNISISAFTSLKPNELLFVCKSIEYFLGREIRGKWLEREIDIDIIFYGNEIINLPKLKIPHPQLHLRKFVLIPINELEPDLIHPVNNERVSEILSKCTDQSSIERYEKF